MRLGLDISQIVYQGTGVSRFTKGLVDAILRYDSDNQWTFFFASLRRNLDHTLEKEIRQKGVRIVKAKMPPTLLSFFWNQIHTLPIESLVGQLDWFISSDWTEPPAKKIKKATIVHDLVYLRFPETVDKTILETQKKRLKWVKKESRIIFADSQQTKNDLIDLLDMQKDKVVVNYPGVDVTVPDKATVEKTLKKYRIDKPFVLSVGKVEPRKNYNRLIDAFGLLGYDDIDLIIIGPKGWQELNEKNAHIKIINHVSDEELFSFYRSCLFFIMPSIWEGFGYPIVEAMRLGAPVTCAKVSSLMELGGQAVLFFNPLKVDEISQAIKKMTEEKTIRQSLSEKGLEQSKQFSWKRYYNNLIEGLEIKKYSP
jgi:glycosyltransferase involved in cell wall biosynthesis